MKADGQLGSGDISAARAKLSDAPESTYGDADMCNCRGVAPAEATPGRPVKVRGMARIMSKVKM
jgi:hypothetical protein